MWAVFGLAAAGAGALFNMLRPNGNPNHAPPLPDFVEDMQRRNAAERRRLARQEEQQAIEQRKFEAECLKMQQEWQQWEQEHQQQKRQLERQMHEQEQQFQIQEEQLRQEHHMSLRQLNQERETWQKEHEKQLRALEQKRIELELGRQEQQKEHAGKVAKLRQWEALVQEKERELRERKTRLQKEQEAARKAEEELRNYPKAPYQMRADWENTINIGVAGEVSVGKSSFINVLRGLSAKDPGAAAVGVNQQTMEPTPYPFPQNDAVRLWDLPGYATQQFQQRTKLRDMGIRYFYAIILICDSPLKESMLEVIEELHQHKVPYFVVRNKIDQDITNNSADLGVSESETMQEVANALAIQGVPVSYLITCRNPQKYDFNKLAMDLRATIAKAS